MMNPGSLFPVAIGLLLLALGAHNELQWRRRLWHQVLTGCVIDLHSDEDGSCFPEIEYNYGGLKKRFRSAYAITPTPFIGEHVKIVTDRYGENAEYFTNKTRWYFTVFPISVGLVSIAIGLF